jgi:hypothetical protein
MKAFPVRPVRHRRSVPVKISTPLVILRAQPS